MPYVWRKVARKEDSHILTFRVGVGRPWKLVADSEGFQLVCHADDGTRHHIIIEGLTLGTLADWSRKEIEKVKEQWEADQER